MFKLFFTLVDDANATTARSTLGLATVAATGAYSDLSGTPTAYTLPTATTSTLGGVRIDGTTITISSGIISSGQFLEIDGGSASTTYSTGDLEIDGGGA